MCNCGNNGCGGCGGVSLPAGPAGPNGLNAFTFTTASFVQPTLATAAIVVPVSGLGQYTGLWATVGQWIFIEGAGTFVVTARTPTSITIDVPNAAIAALNAVIAAFGSTVTAGKAVSPSGIQGATGATGPAGSNGTNAVELLAYRIIAPPINNPTAGVYMDMLSSPVNIPANSWIATGDVVKVSFIAMGNMGATSTPTARLEYSFRVVIGGVVVHTISASSWNTSEVFKNSLEFEIDFIGVLGAPFTLLKHVCKSSVGAGSYGLATLFTANQQYRHFENSIGTNEVTGLASASTTTDPTILNTLKIDGTYTSVGGGGGAGGQMMVPYLKVTLHKA